MKKNFKNFNLYVNSDSPLDEHRFYGGIGMMDYGNKSFSFQVERPTKRHRNPLVFDGRYFRVRANRDGNLRFSSVIPGKALLLESSDKRSFQRALMADLRAALRELCSHVENVGN